MTALPNVAWRILAAVAWMLVLIACVQASAPWPNGSGFVVAALVVVGGGFAGAYAALELEKLLRKRRDVEVTLVSQENFVLFTPMLNLSFAAGVPEGVTLQPFAFAMSFTIS